LRERDDADGGVFTPNGSNSTLEVQTLQSQLGLSNVVVTTQTGEQAGDTRSQRRLAGRPPIPSPSTRPMTSNINSAINALTGGLTLDAGHNISAPLRWMSVPFTLRNGSWSQITSDLPAFKAGDSA